MIRKLRTKHSLLTFFFALWAIILFFFFAQDVRNILLMIPGVQMILSVGIYTILALCFLGFFISSLISDKFFTLTTKILCIVSLVSAVFLTFIGNKIGSDVWGQATYISHTFTILGVFLGVVHIFKRKIRFITEVCGGLIYIAYVLLFSEMTIAYTLGMGLGLLITHVYLYAQKSIGLFTLLTEKFLHELEYRRQLAHFVVGAILSLGIFLQIFPLPLLGIVALVGGGAVFFVKKNKLRILKKLLSVFERDHHMEKFPGRGVFYFVVGAFLTTLIFGKDIASAGILILSIGDSITNIVGKDFGRFPLFYNPKKNIEGPMVGALLATLGASLYLPFHYALFASTFAMFVESLPLQIKQFEIDDNVTIPLAAGCVIFVMKMLGV